MARMSQLAAEIATETATETAAETAVGRNTMAVFVRLMSEADCTCPKRRLSSEKRAQFA